MHTYGLSRCEILVHSCGSMTCRCCSTFQLFHEDSYQLRRIHCLPQVLSMLPCVSRLHKLRKSSSYNKLKSGHLTGLWYMHGHDYRAVLAGFKLTGFCMLNLVSTTNIDRNLSIAHVYTHTSKEH